MGGERDRHRILRARERLAGIIGRASAEAAYREAVREAVRVGASPILEFIVARLESGNASSEARPA